MMNVFILNLVWIAAAAVLGFGISTVFAGRIRLSRSLFVGIYLLLVAPFLYAFTRWSSVSITEPNAPQSNHGMDKPKTSIPAIPSNVDLGLLEGGCSLFGFLNATNPIKSIPIELICRIAVSFWAVR